MSFGIGGSLICEQDSAAMREEIGMPMVKAGITTSVDGYISGPNDGPERGLGEGGERLHYWVFGGPWSYAKPGRGEPTGADKEYLDGEMATLGAVVGGRGTFEAAAAWGGTNPWPVPFYVVTHRPEDGPTDAGFTFVDGLETAITRARSAAGDKDVHVMGGADVIRQALRAGYLDELSVSIAPVVLGAGKRLFDGFDKSVDLELIRTFSSPLATHIRYRVVR
jgi:dihydrofolate reductase